MPVAAVEVIFCFQSRAYVAFDNEIPSALTFDLFQEFHDFLAYIDRAFARRCFNATNRSGLNFDLIGVKIDIFPEKIVGFTSSKPAIAGL